MYKKLPETDQSPPLDECRYLILKIIEQAVRDYLSLGQSIAPIEQYYYETACEFIFNDTYTIDYGGKDKTLQDLLDIVDISLPWFRQRVIRLKDQKIRQERIELNSYTSTSSWEKINSDEEE